MSRTCSSRSIVRDESANGVRRFLATTGSAGWDLVTLLDIDTSTPITIETIRFGMRVAAIAIPCARP
jgi:hypothetical protein